MNTSPLHPNDDQLLEALQRSFDVAEPVPAPAVELAYAAGEFDLLLEELAALAYDSASEELVAMRATETEARILSFSTGEVTIDIEIRQDDGVIIGAVTPAEGGEELVAESIGGTHVTTTLDERGRFRVEIDDRVLRLRVVGRVVTPWITA